MFQIDRIPDFPARVRASDSRASTGFVLVGVVIMVLALTILGLSLFSLSSYEAQFMNRSLDEQQALQSAIGGIDRARFALAVAPESLAEVKKYLPYENVVFARATQLKGAVLDSMGVLIGGGNDINLTVTAEYHKVRRTVSGNYKPDQLDNYYKRLITAGAGGILVYDKVGGGSPPLPACGTVILADSIWSNNSLSPGLDCATGTFGALQRPVPVSIEVGPFIAAHSATATVVPFDQPTFTLSGTPGSVSYWYTHRPGTTTFSSLTSGTATITVNGLAVWLIPHGLRFDGFTHIQSGGDPNACLVIVAQDGQDAGGFPGAIWFFAGLLADIPVIFVSDGHVNLDSFNAANGASRADHLSIFSNYVFLLGPTTDTTVNPLNHRMNLSYGAAVMDPLIDALMAVDALPNSVSPIRFPLRKGSWHVTE